MSDKHRISKVTTRAGDKGNTKLATGKTVEKFNPLIKTVGSIDELNSHVGLLISQLNYADANTHATHNDQLQSVQQHLFNMGAVFAMEGSFDAPDSAELEVVIESLNAALPPLTEFVLPGGGLSASQSHVCRATCRRAESQLWELIDTLEDAPDTYVDCARFLNRLSDYFFVLARTLTETTEQQWEKPAH